MGITSNVEDHYMKLEASRTSAYNFGLRLGAKAYLSNDSFQLVMMWMSYRVYKSSTVP